MSKLTRREALAITLGKAMEAMRITPYRNAPRAAMLARYNLRKISK